MFENKTSPLIHAEMLNDISNEYDKTDGSFIFDATKPAANQLESAYSSMDEVVSLLDVENLSGEELTKFVEQRTGIKRRAATYATGLLEVQGNGMVTTGDIFQTESGIQFQATETVTITVSGMVNIKAVIAGNIGNVPANQITNIAISIQGINSVSNPSPTANGYEQESDDELRKRYYERLQTPATSGNKSHYINWAKEVSGVGDVKVFPLWNGDNTVKVVIIDSNLEPANNELVEIVQNHIDPGITGLGEGSAPIGAYCTVASAVPKNINISFTVTLLEGYTIETVQQNVSETVTNYLRSIAFKQNFVSYAQIGNYILDSEGVLDYSGLTVNGGTINIAVLDEEVAVLGGVNIVV